MAFFSDRSAVRRLLLVLVLARVALLVLSGRVSATVVWPTSDQDRVDPRRAAGRGLDVVVTGLGEGTVDQRSTPVLQEAPTVLPRRESGAVRRTVSDTVVVAGAIGLLGVAGGIGFLAHSVARPVRRAVHVLQARPDGLALAAAEQVPTLQAADPADGGTAPQVVEVRSVLPEIARVVREAAQEAARAAEAAAAASTPAAPSPASTGYAAARSRAVGPTTALWHAVELARLAGAVGEVCETTVCGSLVRVGTGQSWPVPARDVCPACATVAR